MARIRAIKPEFWNSESLGTRLPGVDGRQARLLFIALWNHAEDHGVCRAAPALLKAAAFVYDDDVTPADVSRWLGMLEAGGFIVRYSRSGSSYAWIRSFDEHQKIDRKSKTTLPEPSADEIERRASPLPAKEVSENQNEFQDSSTRRALDEHSLQEGKGREGRGMEDLAGSADAAPPVTLDFELTTQEPPREAEKPPRAPRKPSAAQVLYAKIQEAREARCVAAGVPFVPDRWEVVLQNTKLGPVAKPAPGEAIGEDGMTETQRRFDLALGEYLSDERHMAKGWPLGLFMDGRVRSRYEQQAVMGVAS